MSFVESFYSFESSFKFFVLIEFVILMKYFKDDLLIMILWLQPYIAIESLKSIE